MSKMNKRNSSNRPAPYPLKKPQQSTSGQQQQSSTSSQTPFVQTVLKKKKNRKPRVLKPPAHLLSQLPIMSALFRWPVVEAHVPVGQELEADELFDKVEPIDDLMAITFARFLAFVKIAPLNPDEFDSYNDLLIITDWVDKLIGFFPLATEHEGKATLVWVMYFRNSVAHQWLKKILKHHHLYLSAVLFLSSDRMMNDPELHAATEKCLNDLHLVPVMAALLPPT